MKQFLFGMLAVALLGTLIATKPIGTLGNVDTVLIGGHSFADNTNLITLAGYTTGSNTKATLRKMGGSAGYQVTSGKTLHIYAVHMNPASAINFVATLAQTDNDVGQDTTSSFTNPVYIIGDSAFPALTIQATAGGVIEASFDFPVSALKYVSVLHSGAGTFNFIAYGYEL